jgi:hypothetical protein
LCHLKLFTVGVYTLLEKSQLADTPLFEARHLQAASKQPIINYRILSDKFN